MTVSSTLRKAGPFNGNGVTTAFPFAFKVFAKTDVQVVKTSAAGAQTTLVLDSDYSVALNADQDNSPGGTITYPVSGTPLAAGETLNVIGSLTYDQGTDITNLGRFLPQVHENVFDRIVMLAQQLLENFTRAIIAPVGDTATTLTLPSATNRANKALVFDATGSVGVSADIAAEAAAAAASAATAQAAATQAQTVIPPVQVVDYTALRAYAGTATTLQVTGYLVTAAPAPVAGTFTRDDTDTTSADNGGTIVVASNGKRWKRVVNGQVNLQWFGAKGDGVADDTTAVQTFVNAISSNTAYGAPKGFIPPGRYKLTSTINFPSTYCDMSGAGMFQSQFACDGVTGSVFKVAAITYFKPHWSDFSIVDGTLTTTGIGIDTTALTPSPTAQMFDFEFKNIYIYTKGDAFVSYAAFSGQMTAVVANSSTGHGFRVACGPAVKWTGCYASNIGAGKAGYRLTGSVYLDSCNGVDSADYWGVFGLDTAATDGFQNDFPGASPDYPVVTLLNCNVERFNLNGITLHNSYKQFHWIGGKLDRNALSTAYTSMITARLSPVYTNTPIILAIGSIFKGTGVPNGGGALTNAWLYAPSPAQVVFVDQTGAFANAGITGFYAGIYAGLVPMATVSALNDVYQGSATAFNAVKTGRLSLGYTKYTTPAALTPVGSAQAISVTGYSKVTVTPVAAASITTATFDQTPGAGTDYLRNGDLLIEAGNGNLTVNHSASGANTFRMASGLNVTMTAGQILRFCWSSTSTQWIQV